MIATSSGNLDVPGIDTADGEEGENARLLRVHCFRLALLVMGSRAPFKEFFSLRRPAIDCPCPHGEVPHVD